MPDVFVSSKNKNKEKSSKTESESLVGDKQEIKKHLEEEKEGQLIEMARKKKNRHKMPGHSHNPLAPYCLFPDNVRFVNADAKEEMVLLLRKHPITNLPWIIISFLMIIAPFFVAIFPFFGGLTFGFKLVMISSWYLIVVAFILEKFLSWFFNVNLITDERIFDVDFLNLMYREITEADIDQIQDVSVEVSGGLKTFFDYGDVLIQTASQIPKVEFQSIPHPDRVAKVLRELGIQEEIEKIEGRIR